MSAFKKIQCTIVDKSSLLDALKELDLTPEVHESPVNLNGYLGDRRNNKAEIVIPRAELNKQFTGASNDFGFSFNGKSYDMICSEYDNSLKVPQRILQAYAKVVIQKELAKQRFNVKIDGELNQKDRVKVNVVARKLV